MNREQRERRERYEQGGLQGTLLFTEGLFFLHGSRFPLLRDGENSPWILPRTALELQGTLNFVRFEVPMDTPFFVRVFRAFRGENLVRPKAPSANR